MQQVLGTTHDTQTTSAETTRKTARGYYMRSTPTNMGFNPVAASITLTDQRVVIAPTGQGAGLVGLSLAALGVLKPVAFPLCHIRSVGVYPKAVWGKRDVLRIEFDNEGREYLWVQPAEEWLAAIEAARTTADEMQYSALPAVKNGVEASSASSAGRLLLVMLGVMVALALACVVMGGLVSLMH